MPSFRQVLSTFSGFIIFIFSVLTLICGVGFIIFGCLLQTPPTTAIPVCLVVFGSIMLVYSLFGFVSACYPKKGCLICYIVWGFILAVIQLALVLVCIINPEKVVNKIVEGCDTQNDCNGLTDDEQQVHNYVYTGRWVFLGWVCATYLVLIIAAMTACCCNRKQTKYRAGSDQDADVEAARDRLRSIQMQQVESQGSKKKSSFNFGRKKDTPLMTSQEYKANTADIAQKYNMGAKAELPASDNGYSPPIPPAPLATPPPAKKGAW